MHRLPKFLITALLTLLLLPQSSFAFEPFTVKDIRLEGLQRISAGTVFNYLPIKVGDTVDEGRNAEAIRTLFKTGFFKDVRLEQENNTLVVVVHERASIAGITFSGNKSIETDELLDSLKQVGFSTGRVFNRTVFEKVEQELQRSYFGLGKYGVQIESTITPLERNRVSVNFDVTEGKAARIRQINIVGNDSYEEEDLLDLFKLSTTKMLSVFTKSDQYSKQKLGADLESLRSFYLDNGYINFNIDSTQVSITPDKKDIYVTVNVTEGDQYRVSDIRLAGNFDVPEEELFKLVKVQRSKVFSRKEVADTRNQLADRLGNDGYAFANVNAVPDINEEKKEVALTFFLDPGKRVYVRRINFEGNTKTKDDVLRREMRQIESASASTSAIERSRVRLERLGYFKEVNVETPAVPGTADQVDVNFTVVEQPSGNLSAGLGFSQSQGVVVQTSISQDNFLGTGNSVTGVFNNSTVNRNFSLGYLNPYYTDDGISRGFNGYYRTTDAGEDNLSDYTLDEIGGGVSFGLPINETETVRVGFSAERTDFKVGGLPSAEVLNFRTRNGDSFNTFLLDAGWTHDTRNRRIFPDSGGLTRLSGEVAVPGSDLTYFKATARHQQFFPLTKRFTLILNGEIGYGDGYLDTERLPLIDNFFVGGIRTVRGFEANTLGPRDSNGDPMGGDLKMVGNAEIILPVPFAPNTRSVRLTSFVDIGNVYGPNQDFDVGDLRSAVGVSAVWLSPLGAMTVSIAAPLKKESTDDTQSFQFTFGTSF